MRLRALRWRYPVGRHDVSADQGAHKPHALFYEINRRALELELIPAAEITTEIEGPTVTDQRPRFVYSSTYHRHTVSALTDRVRRAFDQLCARD